MGYLSILISSRARSRHRASRSSFPRASHPHLVAALTPQIPRSLLLAHTDAHTGRLRMTSFSVADLLHPLDPRCAVSRIRRRHPSCFDWTPSRPSFLSPTPNHIFLTKIGRVTRPQITTRHTAHTPLSACTITKFSSISARQSILDFCHDCKTMLRLRLPPIFTLFMIKWAAHDDVADVLLCGLVSLCLLFLPYIFPQTHATRYVTTPGDSG